MNGIKRSRNLRLFWLGGLLGALAFLCIFGFSALNVCNDAFCRGGFVEKDIQQHYAGWLFLRESPLSFPFCIAKNINAPSGISVAYTDSIPLFAAFFRLFGAVLPETFQYFGLFSLLCYILQGGFAALLLGLFAEGLAFPLVGSLFFSFSPIMVERTLHHTALAAHFFILAALYFYFRSWREERIRYPLLWALNALSITIHPYLVPMTYAITFAMLAEYAWRHKRFWQAVCFLVSDLAATIFLGWCFGLFGTGGTGGSEMLYGYFSMNLNALWNPTSLGTEWSLFLPVQNQIRGNYDSFNYLGLAILLLAALGFVGALCRPRDLLQTLKSRFGLVFVSLCLTVFAVSNQITANGASLLTIPLPGHILALCSVFRASGRLFWPVFYLLTLFAVLSVRRFFSGRRALLVLCLALALQLADLSPALLARSREIRYYQEEFPSELTGSFWDEAARYRHIFSLDGPQEDFLHLALWAADHGMTTNDPFTARYDAASLEEQRAEAKAMLLQASPAEDTLYLCRSEETFLQLADAMRGAAWCGVVDGKWYVIAPGMQDWPGTDALAYDENYPLTAADYTDDNWNRGLLSWDGCTLLFYDVPFVREKLKNAAALLADGQRYEILTVDDRDAGWLMVTLDTSDASPLCGVPLNTEPNGV